MNIHIQDNKLFTNLLDSTIFNIEMGSNLYGLKDENSDTDFLCIYAPPVNQISSFNKSIHQIQYKDVNHKVDYVFTDLYSFFWNLFNGDSTINFEVLHTEEYKKSEFGETFKYITPQLRTYNVIVAYLGFANRDIKYFWKEQTTRDKIKKILHIYRGLYFAKQIFYDYKNFSLTKHNLSNERKRFEGYELEKELDNVFKQELDFLYNEIKTFRQEVLNVALEKKEIIRFLSVEHQRQLDDALYHFSNKPMFLNKQKRFMDLDAYYSINENELKY